jgi:hypothetical protein
VAEESFTLVPPSPSTHLQDGTTVTCSSRRSSQCGPVVSFPQQSSGAATLTTAPTDLQILIPADSTPTLASVKQECFSPTSAPQRHRRSSRWHHCPSALPAPQAPSPQLVSRPPLSTTPSVHPRRVQVMCPEGAPLP